MFTVIDERYYFYTDSCLYGDVIGVVFTNGWTCADMVEEAPYNCPYVPSQCCASCAPSTTTTTPTTTTTVPTTTPAQTTTSAVTTTTSAITTTAQSLDADAQCDNIRGPGSYMCRVYILLYDLAKIRLKTLHLKNI